MKRVSLRVALIIPFVVAVTLAVGALIVVQEWMVRLDTQQRMEQHAASVLDGLAARLNDHRRAKEVYASLLSRDETLAAAVSSQNVQQIAQVLLPLKASLGLGFLRVHDQSGAVLLAIGESDDTVHAGLLAESRAGLSSSLVTADATGLQVVASAPIKAPSGLVGSILVGKVYRGDTLAQFKSAASTELLVLHGDRVVATTAPDHTLASQVHAIANDLESGLSLDVMSARRGYYSAVHRLSAADCLIALVPTDDIIASSQQRSLSSLVGLFGLVVVLTVGGIIVVQRLSRSLTTVTATAAKIQDGDFSHQIGSSRIVEFDVVGKALNTLTVRVKEQLSELTHQAFYDRLTDLPNRALLKDRLRQGLARASRRGGRVAVMFLDLDNFKVVNDSLGHEVGDALLVALANRLRESVRPEDTVARLGGDEFVVLIDDVLHEEEARQIAERLHERLAPQYQVVGHQLFAIPSVGIALSSADACDPDDLLRNADVAMYHAKGLGKGRCVVFEPRMNADAAERLAIETDLRGALERGELRVAYQPIVHLDTGRVLEVEALLRWDHPTRGPISPAQFVPIAEETGLIVQLGRWVLQQATEQMRTWHCAHPEAPLMLSVNLSARQFQHPSLVADVRRALEQSGLSPTQLKLEITESTVMHDVDAAVRILEQFKTIGIHLALDDFGTGYSSLAQLRRLPVDILKIDRAFVSRLSHGSQDESIVRSIMSLADSLQLAVTGEGIETLEQANQLRSLGCTQGQGFFYARALSPMELDHVLRTYPPTLPHADPATSSITAASTRTDMPLAS